MLGGHTRLSGRPGHNTEPNGTVDVEVVTPGGTSATSAVDKFTHAAPVPKGIGPSSGAAGGGTLVDISGSDFAGAIGVNFGSIPALNVVIDSDTLLEVRNPRPEAATWA